MILCLCRYVGLIGLYTNYILYLSLNSQINDEDSYVNDKFHVHDHFFVVANGISYCISKNDLNYILILLSLQIFIFLLNVRKKGRSNVLYIVSPTNKLMGSRSN